jgi:hypothetical protein
MIRDRALKIVLVLVGLFFATAAYPAIGGLHNPVNSDTGDTMQMAIYATLGIFLLIASRNPAAPQPDCLCRMVEFRSRGGHVDVGT